VDSGEQAGKSTGNKDRWPSWKAFWAIVLTFNAGWVNAAGYLRAERVLTGNMSGNTTESAIGIVTDGGHATFLRGLALALFFAGLLLCAFIHDYLERKGVRSTVSVTLGMEAALLLAVAVRQGGTTVTIVVLALAMGLQNATLTRVGVLSVRTTHVTGTISQMAEATADYLFWLRDDWRRRAPDARALIHDSLDNDQFRTAALTGGLWLAFFAGAAAIVLFRSAASRYALLPAVFLLALAIAYDLRHPMAAQHLTSRTPTFRVDQP
jgi:uncharacterized membrane protein YoaK (UPF0700 family)